MSEQPQPPGTYPVGAIVNGWVWTGTEWAPALVQPTPPPPPVQYKPPASAKFDGLPTATKTAIIVAGLLLLFAAMGLYLFLLK